MITEFHCPVCEGNAWRALQEIQIEREGDWSDYVRLRRRIFFEVWFPGEQSVSLSSRHCSVCGFVAFSPRPTEQDIDAKYRFLQVVAREVSFPPPTEVARHLDEARGQRIYATVRRHVHLARMRILDFGGADGKLLAPFLKGGHECELVDYTERVIPGVKKIGDTLAEAPADRKYDAILCSHVLEHVADPSQIVAQLAARLSDGGVIYAEVPLEMWRGMSALKWDPVTHINYYNLASFEWLFTARGLSVLESREAGGTYGSERFEVVIVVAGRSGGRREPRHDGVARTFRRVQPTAMMLLRRSWRLRRRPTIREFVDCARQSVPLRLRKAIKKVLGK